METQKLNGKTYQQEMAIKTKSF